MFGRSRVRFLTRRPAITIEVFRGFPQFLQGNITGLEFRIHFRENFVSNTFLSDVWFVD